MDRRPENRLLVRNYTALDLSPLAAGRSPLAARRPEPVEKTEAALARGRLPSATLVRSRSEAIDTMSITELVPDWYPPQPP